MNRARKIIVGQRIKAIREREGLTQKEFYKVVNGKSTPYGISLVSRIETGAVGISAENAWNIIKAFPDKKYRLQWLFGFDDDGMTESEYFTRHVFNDAISWKAALKAFDDYAGNNGLFGRVFMFSTFTRRIECISRTALIAYLDVMDMWDDECRGKYVKRLNDLPTVSTQPQKGVWLLPKDNIKNDEISMDHAMCSVCRNKYLGDGEPLSFHYCYTCGSIINDDYKIISRWRG